MPVKNQIVVAADLVDEHERLFPPPHVPRQRSPAGGPAWSSSNGLAETLIKTSTPASANRATGSGRTAGGTWYEVDSSPHQASSQMCRPTRRPRITTGAIRSAGRKYRCSSKHVVVGQEHLVDVRRDAALLEHAGRSWPRDAPGTSRCVGWPDDHGQSGRRLGRQLVDGPIARRNKPFPQQQILGRIAADDEFRGNQNVRARLPGLAGGRDRTNSQLPARSPTVGLSCASAIFTQNSLFQSLRPPPSSCFILAFAACRRLRAVSADFSGFSAA